MNWRYAAYPLLFGVIAAVCVTVANRSGGNRQRWNMQAAEDFIPTLSPQVRGDHRFDNVKVVPYTAQDGSLGVIGYVTDEEACADLRRIVLDSRPPVPIAFLVHVLPVEVLTPATRPQG